MLARNTCRDKLEQAKQLKQLEQLLEEEITSTIFDFIMLDFTKKQNSYLEQLMQRVARLIVQNYKESVVVVVVVNFVIDVVSIIERLSIEIFNNSSN